MEHTKNNYGTQAEYNKNEQHKAPKKFNKSFDNRLLIGIVVILIGLSVLLYRVFPWLIPDWLFTWRTLLIALGFLIGAQKNFSGNAWWILIVVGTYFLIDDMFFDIAFMKPLLFPLIIIIIGVLLIARSRRTRYKDWTPPYESYTDNDTLHQDADLPLIDQPVNESNTSSFHEKNNSQQEFNEKETQNTYQNTQYEGVNFDEDFIQLNSFFSSNKRVVSSKKFRGGNITCMLGGAEIDLMQADFNGVVYMDIFTLMGGVEIIVPSGWTVKNELVCIMGGVDDARRFINKTNTHKILVLKGTVIMGGVEIKSY